MLRFKQILASFLFVLSVLCIPAASTAADDKGTWSTYVNDDTEDCSANGGIWCSMPPILVIG